MILRLEAPHLRLSDKQGAFLAAFPLEDTAAFLAAWTGREAFYSGVDVWGGRVHLLLALVGCVSEHTAEVIELLDAEEAERKQRRLMDSDAP